MALRRNAEFGSVAKSKRQRLTPRGLAGTGAVLALTFSTGVIDAVGFLGLDRVFTGNMTGNVVILGMAVTGAENLPVLGPALALAGFVGGAAVGGRVLRGCGAGWSNRARLLFGAVAVVLIVCVLVSLAHPLGRGSAAAEIVTTVLGVAMGLQASAARKVAVQDVTTVVVTSTLTGFAADSWFGSNSAVGTGLTLRRFCSVMSILAGALMGAVLLSWHIGAALAVSLLITSAVVIMGGRKRGQRSND